MLLLENVFENQELVAGRGVSNFGTLLMAKPVRDPPFSRTQIPSAALKGLRKCSKTGCKKVAFKVYTTPPTTHIFGVFWISVRDRLFGSTGARWAQKVPPESCTSGHLSRALSNQAPSSRFSNTFSSSACGAIIITLEHVVSMWRPGQEERTKVQVKRTDGRWYPGACHRDVFEGTCSYLKA